MGVCLSFVTMSRWRFTMQEDKSYRKVIRNWQIKAFRPACSICYETLRAFHRFGCRPDLQSMLGLALNLEQSSF